ncbi:YpiB family protein [Alicyclobacillus mali]|uniref:YpiB family protein n=1 Tax=Alicyclobacillus mali (ex Roth et al. 2021) TaxID=1123961 RepID=A0ABS0F2D4_9BACL|nr:YpiB family protein [Alicyclobacillus mali (ex Roth et al. 2021)]MBF8377458.1 YpiB family protein [Alicyclobacillus mali (ex Roth et al. 2021)]MCL6487426.1 YpiB family protein [Alicyclobacillus mali (ex Roth et al. 2021)]
MGTTVSVAEKKHFLRWFLANYRLQSREAEMLLRYMMSRENILERVHFVDNFRQFSRVIVVSTTCVHVAPFRYYRRNKPVTTDVEQAFMDLYQHPDEDIYVGLFFKDRSTCPEFASVLEEPARPDLDPAIREMLSVQADLVIEQALRAYRRDQLMRAVDAALDAGDKRAFLAASERLIQFDRGESLEDSPA